MEICQAGKSYSDRFLSRGGINLACYDTTLSRKIGEILHEKLRHHRSGRVQMAKAKKPPGKSKKKPIEQYAHKAKQPALSE
jgi:hypothetical protein